VGYRNSWPSSDLRFTGGSHPKTIWNLLQVAIPSASSYHGVSLEVNFLVSAAFTPQHIGCVTLLVKNYDEAKAWYCDALNFVLIQDEPLSGDKRWVLIAPSKSAETRLLLALAATPEQAKSVGDQAGGRVFLFLHTRDLWATFRHMQAKGVRFLEQPRTEPYGTVVVFEDLYGNRWDLLQLTSAEAPAGRRL
jgi:catechol 2,3-dioxygenase-like lactoylglutathione lyase family enzyme